MKITIEFDIKSNNRKDIDEFLHSINNLELEFNYDWHLKKYIKKYENYFLFWE